MNAVRTQPQTSLENPAPSALPNLPAERRLVQRVFERCHEAITKACAKSSVPAEFLGALVANESGGYGDATRFEPAVYRHLVAVAEGRRPSYGSVNAASLDAEIAELAPAHQASTLHERYMTRGFAEVHSGEVAQATDDALRELATSWGYTQIMGYHMVARPGGVHKLLDPDFHFRMAVWLLSEFTLDYRLDAGRDFAEMFCCWNTGRPNGRTFDPDYVANGLRRMQIYRQLGPLPQAGHEGANASKSVQGLC
ncbi:MAG TPA: hypothetical protein VFJ52_08370 [Terriglobia bacterium]|nr:hypothetical protein [Terriglobia bacterium]